MVRVLVLPEALSDSNKLKENGEGWRTASSFAIGDTSLVETICTFKKYK